MKRGKSMAEALLKTCADCRYLLSRKVYRRIYIRPNNSDNSNEPKLLKPRERHAPEYIIDDEFDVDCFCRYHPPILDITSKYIYGAEFQVSGIPKINADDPECGKFKEEHHG